MRKKFDKFQLMWLLVFFVSGSTAQVLLQLHKSSVWLWALFPVLAFSALMVIRSIFQKAWQFDLTSHTGVPLGGTKFIRNLRHTPTLETTFTNWAEKNGYMPHLTSTELVPAFKKAPLGLMPIFVILIKGDAPVLEAWVQVPSAFSRAITNGFTLSFSNRCARNDLNLFLAEAQESPV